LKAGSDCVNEIVSGERYVISAVLVVDNGTVSFQQSDGQLLKLDEGLLKNIAVQESGVQNYVGKTSLPISGRRIIGYKLMKNGKIDHGLGNSHIKFKELTVEDVDRLKRGP
jgi:hypothetical protein